VKPIAPLALAASLAVAPAARAFDVPAPGPVDPRIRTVQYDPDQVVQLKGWFGFQQMIEFAPDEHIENVSVGDALGWQITPNKRANLLFLKPIDRSAVTNMTVVTDKRRYAFDLTVATEKAQPGAMAYVVRFRYPQAGPVQIIDTPPPPAPVAEAVSPDQWNFAYTYSGSKDLLPAKVFDDGRSTYFSWAQGASVPGIFAVGAEGSESLVNYAVRGQYLVVDQLSPRFVLRNGKSVTTVINGAYAPPTGGPGAPAPADPKAAKRAKADRGLILGLFK
jgi:type IV secretion system protein VirB9